MKKRIKEFVDYYKNLGLTKSSFLLIAIILYFSEMIFFWHNFNEYFDFVKRCFFDFNLESSLFYLFSWAIPLIIFALLIYQLAFKRINVALLITDYIFIIGYVIVLFLWGVNIISIG